jgi:hypothetical protein
VLSAALLGLATFAFGLGGVGADPAAPTTAFDLFAHTDELRGEDSEAAEEPDACGLLSETSLSLALLDDPWLELPEATIMTSSHLDIRGALFTYDQIPRRPDRPSDYEAYRYPVARYLGWPAVASGYDLDQPSEHQRRGAMRAIGHGGVDLAQFMGAPINMVPLTHQVGDAEVLYVGPLFGNTVVTRHAVREGGGQRDYVLLFGHLSEAASGMRRGHMVRAGELVGLVGDSDSPNLVHLHLEARRLRDGVDPKKLTVDALFSSTVVTDPRNVLPLGPASPAATAACRNRSPQGRYRLGEWRLQRPTLAWTSLP